LPAAAAGQGHGAAGAIQNAEGRSAGMSFDRAMGEQHSLVFYLGNGSHFRPVGGKSE